MTEKYGSADFRLITEIILLKELTFLVNDDISADMMQHPQCICNGNNNVPVSL